jgi:excisionase family DNA binding protein
MTSASQDPGAIPAGRPDAARAESGCGHRHGVTGAVSAGNGLPHGPAITRECPIGCLMPLLSAFAYNALSEHCRMVFRSDPTAGDAADLCRKGQLADIRHVGPARVRQIEACLGRAGLLSDHWHAAGAAGSPEHAAPGTDIPAGTPQPVTAGTPAFRPGKFLTVAEVATVMRVSKMTIYRLVWRGELENIRVGRSVRVPEEAVRQYLQDASVPPTGNGRHLAIPRQPMPFPEPQTTGPAPGEGDKEISA